MVVVVVFFTLTYRPSTIPIHIRGCQSGTWSAGQENIRGTSTKLQREHKNKAKQKMKRQKGRNNNTQHMPEKIEEGHSIERSLV